MADKKEDLDAITWQRETSAFGTVLARGITQALLAHDTGENALDLACGDGLLTREICKHFRRVVAVDASRHHIATAQRRAPKAEFHVSLIEDFDPPANELFERIYMISILEHLENAVETLVKVKRWLSNNGSIVVLVPNALSLNRRIGQRIGIIGTCYDLTQSDIELGHKRFYDMASLVDDIVRSGLVITGTGGVLLKPFSNAQMEWFVRNWGEANSDPGWCTKLCDALNEMGNSLPEYANSIWVRCRNQQTDEKVLSR